MKNKHAATLMLGLLMADGMDVQPPMRTKTVYRTVSVINTVTGKTVDVPEHNVEHFLSKRTARWQVKR